MEKRSCAACQIQYYVPREAEKTCPLCSAHQEIGRLQGVIHELRSDVQLAMQNSERLSVQVNELDAMRKALTVISKDDLAFVKSVVYRMKADETSVTLVATQDHDDRWLFLVRTKKAGAGRIAEEHHCTSMGGIALAASFMQATKVSGTAQATRMLLRSLSQHLAQVEGM